MERSTIGILAAAIALVGCGGANPAPANPPAAALTAVQNQSLAAGDAHRVRRGIYVSEFYGSTILGYPTNNPGNDPPLCTVPGVSYVNAIAVDGRGNLMVPDGGSHAVFVFKGPKMCGHELGSFGDPYGAPGDAASNDATNGIIAVATSGASGTGSIAICTLSGGCTKDLTNPNIGGEVAGVAMALNGDCWVSSTTSAGTASLTYFRRCAGAGTAATGFKNAYDGGLDIDIHGNLVSVDALPALWIYRGCNPHCTVAGGPFPMRGYALFGHLNEKSTEFAAADYACGCVDVYGGSITKGLVYKYSFNNGLTASDDVIGLAYDPRSKE